MNDLSSRFEIANHDGKGLLFAEFSFSERLNRATVLGITAQMISADALNGDDTAVSKQGSGLFDAGLVETRSASRSIHRVVGTAGDTSDRLGMKTSIEWISV